MDDRASELKRRYEEFARTLDHTTTACDFYLRELEIDMGSSVMKDGDRVLDVGCGLGYGASQYALRHRAEIHGIDYAENMIEGAKRLLSELDKPLKGTIEFRLASVTELPFPQAYFDVVTSSRCLMALLEWGKQQDALLEIHRVLKPGGALVLMEGTMEGLERLNALRVKFHLPLIEADGRDRLFTRKFRESELLEFCAPWFSLERTQRFGMYFFLSRIVHPLLVAPEPPQYDARINEVAREIARAIPDYEGIGPLVAFLFRKRGRA